LPIFPVAVFSGAFFPLPLLFFDITFCFAPFFYPLIFLCRIFRLPKFPLPIFLVAVFPLLFFSCCFYLCRYYVAQWVDVRERGGLTWAVWCTVAQQQVRGR